jgi:hypothetical protein
MNVLAKMLGINYRTTVLGIGVIFAAAGRVVIAYRAKDFESLANDGQLIAETITALLAGVGLFIAKDSAVTGVGSQAKSVDSEGVLKNAEGKEVAHQPPA